jgi:hypothetical protein
VFVLQHFKRVCHRAVAERRASEMGVVSTTSGEKAVTVIPVTDPFEEITEASTTAEQRKGAGGW